jgi:hypothetical protein
MRLWLGSLTFIVGAALWYRSQRAPERGPPWLGRVGLGAGALGMSTLSMTQQGLSWTIASICFSIVAIVLLAWVIVEMLRR